MAPQPIYLSPALWAEWEAYRCHAPGWRSFGTLVAALVRHHFKAAHRVAQDVTAQEQAKAKPRAREKGSHARRLPTQ